MSNSNPEQQFEHDDNQQQIQIKSTIPTCSLSLPRPPLQQQSVSQIKLQLVQLNQQLLKGILSDPNSNNQHHLQLLQLTQQLQLHCDNVSTIEFDLKQQEIESEYNFTQQQKIIAQQQFELKQLQIDFERIMLERESKYEQKCIDFEQHVKSTEFDFQRHEFELNRNKRQSTSNTSRTVINQGQQEQMNQQQTRSNYNDNVDFTNPTQLHTHTTSTITSNDQQHSSNEAVLQAFHDLHQDYQAMKYLVEQSIVSNQTLDQSCTLLLQQQHQNQQPASSIQQQQVDSLQTQSQLNEILEILSSHLPKVEHLQTQMSNVDQYLQTLQGNLTRLHTRLVPLELAAKSTSTSSSTTTSVITPTTPTPTTTSVATPTTTTSSTTTSSTTTTTTTSTPTAPATTQPTSSSTTSTMVSTKPVTSSLTTTTPSSPTTLTPTNTTTTPSINQKLLIQPTPVPVTMINTALAANHNSHTSNPPSMFISFHFDNLHGVYQSCHRISPSKTLFEIFYQGLVDNWLKQDLNPLKTTIQASKLYISSSSVANGQWIQIQGQGSPIDMNTLKLKYFIKSGDDIHSYQSYPCSKNCIFCISNSSHRDTTSNRFVIKFKWV